MNIYNPKPITQNIEENFRPTRLYIKELAGIKYFGKSVKEDIDKYLGSGTIWKDRIKKYGKENIKTIWVSDWFYCPYYIQQFALMLSEINQIVESDDWANYRPEDGLAGGRVSTTFSKGRKDTRTPETKAIAAKKASEKLRGMKKPDGFGEKVRQRTLGSTLTESTKEKMKDAWSDERRTKQRERTRRQNLNRPTLTCPHCKFESNNTGAMRRYHFDNCFIVKPKIKPVRSKKEIRSTEWSFISPSGEIFKITNLRKFCQENNLNNGTMCDVALGNRKQHKGWKLFNKTEMSATSSEGKS